MTTKCAVRLIRPVWFSPLGGSGSVVKVVGIDWPADYATAVKLAGAADGQVREPGQRGLRVLQARANQPANSAWPWLGYGVQRLLLGSAYARGP